MSIAERFFKSHYSVPQNLNSVKFFKKQILILAEITVYVSKPLQIKLEISAWLVTTMAKWQHVFVIWVNLPIYPLNNETASTKCLILW